MGFLLLLVLGQHLTLCLIGFFMDVCSLAIHECVKGCKLVAVVLLEFMHFVFVSLVHFVESAGL